MSYNRSIRFLLAMSVAYAVGAHAQSLPAATDSPVPAMQGDGVGSATPSTEESGQSIQSLAQGLINNALGTPDDRVFSYGTSSKSILFLPDQVSRMKDAIGAYESENKNSNAATPVNQDAVSNQTAQPQVNLNEPDTYPVFFLSSIVYNSEQDWSIWMGGEKITSRKNDTEVEVLNVKRDSATFRWKPIYATAIGQREQAAAFASTDKVKNKLSVSHPISFDDQSGAITFTLRQNQSFAVGYFKLFEGYIESPNMDPIVAATLATGGSAVTIPSAPNAVPSSMVRPAGVMPAPVQSRVPLSTPASRTPNSANTGRQ